MRAKLFLFVALLCTLLLVNAQPGRMMPYWVTQLPNANANKHYYYRVTMGEASTYDKAYASAFAKAIMEAKWKLGVNVRFSDDVKALENTITEGVNVNQESVNIPMNKVCDYWEINHTPKGDLIRLYVLWQVAQDGITPPNFEDFTKCQ